MYPSKIQTSEFNTYFKIYLDQLEEIPLIEALANGGQ